MCHPLKHLSLKLVTSIIWGFNQGGKKEKKDFLLYLFVSSDEKANDLSLNVLQ